MSALHPTLEDKTPQLESLAEVSKRRAKTQAREGLWPELRSVRCPGFYSSPQSQTFQGPSSTLQMDLSLNKLMNANVLGEVNRL